MNKMNFRLTDPDLHFLVETIAPETSAKYRLRQIIQEDEDSRIFVGKSSRHLMRAE